MSRTLTGAVRSEAKRLTRLMFAGVGAGLMVAFAVFATVIAFSFGDDLLGAAIPPGIGIPIALESERGMVAGLSMAGDLLGIVALSLWAAATASDYTTGWVRIMVQAEPRRGRLVVAKLIALSGFTVAGTVIATIASISLAPLLASATDVSTQLWSSNTVATVLGGWFNLTLSVLVWGVIGLAVATLSRSATVAIGGGLGYLIAFEGMLGLAVEDAATYLPGSIIGAVAAGGTVDLAFGVALALALAVAAAAIAISIATFRRRDVLS